MRRILIYFTAVIFACRGFAESDANTGWRVDGSEERLIEAIEPNFADSNAVTAAGVELLAVLKHVLDVAQELSCLQSDESQSVWTEVYLSARLEGALFQSSVGMDINREKSLFRFKKMDTNLSDAVLIEYSEGRVTLRSNGQICFFLKLELVEGKVVEISRNTGGF